MRKATAVGRIPKREPVQLSSPLSLQATIREDRRDPAPLGRPHSSAFVAAWRDLVADQFGYARAGPFLVVPSLVPGRATLSYLPFLNATDVVRADCAPLVAEAGGRPYLIRALDPGGAIEPGGPVAVRVWLAGLSEDEILARVIKPACRRKLKQAWRAGFTVEEGRDARLARRFHRFVADTLHRRHGVPTLPERFFVGLAADAAIGLTFILLSLHGRLAAALLLLFDASLAWVPWMAADPAAFDRSPNHLLYWRAIAASRAQGCAILDFGRSPYESPTYRFKAQWGAVPVAIAMLRPRPVDVYARYATATTLWRLLPAAVARPLGGRLCRHLADF